MNVKKQTRIEDLYKVDGKAELVNGEIISMPPTGNAVASVGFAIAASVSTTVVFR
jgi:hypothetical protein